MVTVPAVGCEAFADLVFERANQFLAEAGYAPRVRTALVEVREHAGNSAIRLRDA
ncbi:hypothetical protein [Methylobacterium nigriterrae]|uniref:hypothetical protein n=1 Tax=Methylobacterium nigriterrae TaxID=3127512 RepID=UPI003013F767